MSISTCYGTYPLALMENLKTIKCMVFDVDGSITDGGIYFSSNGDEIKKFNIKDGMGIANVSKKSDIATCIITGRKSPIVARRAHELGIKYLYEGIANKALVLDKIIQDLNISYQEVLAFGDDINDISMMDKVGFSACPKNAHAAILNHANFICDFDGGAGACRQICDFILMAHNILDTDGFSFKE